MPLSATADVLPIRMVPLLSKVPRFVKANPVDPLMSKLPVLLMVRVALLATATDLTVAVVLRMGWLAGAAGITTSCVTSGTSVSDQLPAVFQSVSVVPVQVLVWACADRLPSSSNKEISAAWTERESNEEDRDGIMGIRWQVSTANSRGLMPHKTAV